MVTVGLQYIGKHPDPNRSWGVQVAAGSFMPGWVPLVGQYERSNVQLDGGK